MAQTKPAKIWATATFNKSEVMLGEPIVVTVTVYTSTWFSSPPIFEEIQVKGSLMAKLEQRNSATSVTIGRKQYPAIKQRFVIYPNVIGTNTLPGFKVTTNCPPEGGYKGERREIFSKERTFNVLAPPEGIDPKSYIAAYKVSLKDQWNSNFKNLKAGDVLERRVTITASGALAAAIPPIAYDSVEFGSIYVKSPMLVNRQNRNRFSGERTEIINYLLEKEGDFSLPSIKVPWFNIKTKSMDTSSLDSINLSIAANPDLSFILSRQKELQNELAESNKQTGVTKSPFELLGLNWWQLFIVLLLVLVALKMVISWGKRINNVRIHKKNKHLDSADYYFNILKRSVQSESSNDIIKDFYAWYDRYRQHEFGPQFTEFLIELNNPTLNELLRHDMRQIYLSNSSIKPESMKKLVKAIESHKSHKIKNSLKSLTQDLNPINP
ncbi:BatD family protein [Winogradskyella aurantiaca]|uniref:BatD family protein n=1 Tax=Winogradskyella aurantiaca TaxID=2219558 RepID=UPI001300AFB9|nr:BatD family protein [Winogradskyella aurantiaca]